MQGGPAPEGVALDDAGNLYVAGDNKTVTVYSPQTGSALFVLSDGQIGGLHGVAITPGAAPMIFALDTILSQVLGFAAGSRGESAPAFVISVPPATNGPPIAIAIDRNAHLYILAAGGKNSGTPVVLLCHSPQYSCSNTNIFAAADASGVAVDAAGNVYVAATGGSIVQFLPTGPFTYRPNPAKIAAGLCGVAALAFGGGRLVAADECTGTGDTNAQLAAFDATTLAATATIGGQATQLNVSHDARVAVQDSGANAGTIYTANTWVDTVTGYCVTCSGNVLPSAQIPTGHPGLDGVQALYFAGGLLYTADSATPAISIYRAPAAAATGTLQPTSVARIIGKNAQLCGPAFVLADLQGRIFVTNACSTVNDVTVYPAPGGITGDYSPAPSMVIGIPGPCGTATMCNPQQMVLDAANHLYVTNYGFSGDPFVAGSILEFDASSGALLANIVGADIHNPSGIALDPSGNLVVLSNLSKNGQPEVAYFAPPPLPANASLPLSVTPVNRISGPNTLIGNATNDTPFPQLAVDKNAMVYINEFNDVLVFAAGASNNAAPYKVISGPAINGGTGIAIGGLP
jgi:hypothetical protein